MSCLQVSFFPGEVKTPTIPLRINFFYESLISCPHSFSSKSISIGSLHVLFPLHSAINKGMWLALCLYLIYFENFSKKVGVKQEEKKEGERERDGDGERKRQEEREMKKKCTTMRHVPDFIPAYSKF